MIIICHFNFSAHDKWNININLAAICHPAKICILILGKNDLSGISIVGINNMKYFDFKAYWNEFKTLLHNDEDVLLALEEKDLYHPLWKRSAHDGLHEFVSQLIQLDPGYQNECLEAKSKYFPQDQSLEHSEYSSTLRQELEKIWEGYKNKYLNPNTIHGKIPFARCHHLAPALFLIAQKMFPHIQWVLLRGDKHSTVYSADNEILFDLIMYYHFTFNDIEQNNADRVFQYCLGKDNSRSINNFKYRLKFSRVIPDTSEDIRIPKTMGLDMFGKDEPEAFYRGTNTSSKLQ